MRRVQMRFCAAAATAATINPFESVTISPLECKPTETEIALILEGNIFPPASFAAQHLRAKADVLPKDKYARMKMVADAWRELSYADKRHFNADPLGL